MADEPATRDVGVRYYEKFGEMPPEMLWQQDRAGFDALMEQAIKDGRALTADDLYRAQKIEPPEALPGRPGPIL